jgi:hypothetical protein
MSDLRERQERLAAALMPFVPDRDARSLAVLAVLPLLTAERERVEPPWDDLPDTCPGCVAEGRPQRECPEHGDVRLYAEQVRRLTAHYVEARERADRLARAAEQALTLVTEASEWTGYDTRDIGHAYAGDGVDELLADLRAALSAAETEQEPQR